MREAYWLAFTLASIPYFGYLFGMAFIGPVFSRVNHPLPKGQGLPNWLLLLFSLCSFGFALWQQIGMDFFFDPIPDYTNFSSYEQIVNREVFGVTIPLELGKTINRLVASVFCVLLLTVPIIATAIASFRSRSIPRSNRPIPNWAGYSLLLGLVVLFT